MGHWQQPRGSEAAKEGQVEGLRDAELIQVQQGGGEGQVHREEVAGVYQELARSLPVLVLQPPLWGQWSHQDCPSAGVSKQGSPRAPLTSTLLMKRGLTRSSSPVAGVYARRSFTTV